MHNDTLFKRPLPVSSSTNQRKPDGWQKRTRCYSESSSCRVCNDKASVINYGALSCQSCKTFFRRNCLHPQNVQSCSYNSSCDINEETRRYCTACRLAKCFTVGMCTDFIRKEDRKNGKYSLSSKSRIYAPTLQNRVTSISQLWTYDQSHNNRFALTKYERKILSNVTSALDAYNAIPKVRAVIEDDLSTVFGLPFDKIDTVESINCIYTSITSFIKSTPDFHILTTNEKCSLFERNLNAIINLYSAVVFHDANVLNNSHCIESFASIYRLEMMTEFIWICKQLDLDSTITPLMLLILAFSSNCSMVTVQEEMNKDSLLIGTYRLFGSQNVYVEVLWRYMVFRYGFYKSVFRFSQLIKHVLDLIKYSANAYMNNPTYCHLVNGLNQEAKQLLIVNENEEFHLWGRQDG